MTVDRSGLLADVRAALGEGADPPVDGELAVPALVAGWLDDLRAGGSGPGPDDVDALCRQIDVRRRVSARYRQGWKRTDPETAAPDAVVAGVVAVLLSVAERAADPGRDLKAVNSALKALELRGELSAAPALRGWAVELLDQATAVDAP